MVSTRPVLELDGLADAAVAGAPEHLMAASRIRSAMAAMTTAVMVAMTMAMTTAMTKAMTMATTMENAWVAENRIRYDTLKT